MVVLTYHKIENVKNFEEQITYLVKNRYNIISLSDFSNQFTNANFSSRDILITFDDGDYSVLENALPVLKKFSVPATIFVITGLIDTRQPFWWDEILYYTNDKKQVEQAKSLTNDGRMNFLKTLRDRSNLPPLAYRQLTLQELKFMELNGISIGNHSHTHPMLDKLSPHEIENEVSKSATYLKNNGFQHYDVFAYPNGNYNGDSERILSQQETRLAFLFDHQLCTDFHNPLRISRLSVNDSTPWWKFKLILNGWHSQMLPAIKKIHKLI